jgi:hypothetical protein
VLINSSQENGPRRGLSIGVDGGENHGVWLIDSSLIRFGNPCRELLEGIRQEGAFFQRQRTVVLALSERIERHAIASSIEWT